MYNVVASSPILICNSEEMAYPQDRNCIVYSTARSTEINMPCEHLSIYSSFNGEGYFKSRNCRYVVSDYNYLIFNEGTKRSNFISSSRGAEFLSVNFAPAYLKNYFSSFDQPGDKQLDGLYAMEHDRIEFTEQLFEHDLLVSPQLFRIRYLLGNWECNRSQIEEMLFYLIESMVINQRKIWGKMEAVNCAKPSTKRELYERLMRAKDYISSCFKEDISIELLANITCLNQYYFLREFKKFFNFTPHWYIQNQRLIEARRLLKKDDRMVSEICTEVGYHDPASFSKLFKKRYGVTPVQFRQRAGQW